MNEEDKQTEEKIFEAATEVFVEKGMDGARMQDIANRAGINKALLHYYYRTKEHLFNAVFEMLAGEMFRKFAPVFDANLSFDDKIRFFLREHIAFLQKNPGLPLFLLNEINRHPEKITKLINSIDIGKFWKILEEQHHEELKRYNINRETLPQLMTTIAGMSVFPFAARTLLASIMDKMGYDFEEYIEQRKEYAGEFIVQALKSKKAEGQRPK